MALREIAESLAKAAGKKAAESVAKRASKAESVAQGLYHPIGGGVKLKKPVTEMTETTIANPDVMMTEPRILTPEDLYGKAGIPLIGDRAATGKILTHIDERELNRPVTLEGGPEFMLAHHYPEDPMGSSVWASGKGKVSALNNRIRQAAESGQDVLGIYSAGSPTQVDFNAMLSHTLANQIDLDALKKADIKKFNKAIREDHPDFLGLEHPDLDLQLGQKNAGELRKHFVDRMSLKEFQDAGFPNIGQARKAITEPSLLDVPLGSTGFTIGTMNPEGAIVESPRMPHGTYPIHMQGTPTGRLETQLPYDVMFKTYTDARKMLPGNKPQTMYRSYELSQPIQYFDQEWLDNAMKYMESIKGKEYADGGSVKDEATVTETPRNPILGAVSDVLKPVVKAADVYELDRRIPFFGGMTFADLGLKGIQSLAEDTSYGDPILRNTRNIQTTQVDPRLLDVANAIPMVGAGAKAATTLGKTALKEAGRQIETGTGLLGRNVVDPRMNVIKPQGGMLVGGEKELDQQLLHMKKNEGGNPNWLFDETHTSEKDPHALALNNWIDTKVRKYIRNQAGSENDPILKAIESGVPHNFDPAMGDTKYMNKIKRKNAGYPENPTATTELGKEWQDKVDAIFNPHSAEDIKQILHDPIQSYKDPATETRSRLSKLRVEHDLPVHKMEDIELISQIPDKNVYTIGPSNVTARLGLNHVGDVLYEDLQNGKLTPDQLNQMSIEKAIRHTAEYDKQKAREMAKAHVTSVEGFPTPRQYDDGFKWVELKHPTDATKTKQALSSEGKMMGHCVGGYSHDVLSGQSEIYSLRGPDGKSHVTIEANVDEPDQQWVVLNQIKGKQNKRPDEKYQKYITDFIQNNVPGREVVDVNELDNTNLMHVDNVGHTGLVPESVHFHPDVEKAVKKRNAEYGIDPADKFDSHMQNEHKYELFKEIASDFGMDGKPYFTNEDLLNAIKNKYPHKKAGGSVTHRDLEQEFKLNNLELPRRHYG